MTERGMLKRRDSRPGTVNFQLNPDNTFEQKLNHSSASENNSNQLDRHHNVQSHIENGLFDENGSRELINDQKIYIIKEYDIKKYYIK